MKLSLLLFAASLSILPRAEAKPFRAMVTRTSFTTGPQNLELGLRYESVPIVFQYNKRDLPQTASLEAIRSRPSSRSSWQRTSSCAPIFRRSITSRGTTLL